MGKNMAYMEISLALAYLLRHYDIRLKSGDNTGVGAPGQSLGKRPLRTPVTTEHLMSLRKAIEQTVHVLYDHNQQYLQKFANAGQQAMSARDLLFHENSDLFKQNNESNIRASSKSTVVGKGLVMSSKEIREARRKHEGNDASEERRRGHK